ncbi:hypothetical protein [Actinomadura nitritigenes]|uniref:hypothetical protein n=1 Tax=Actinomadura nitritigenes TaxID=134602 RepID=UPI003D8CFFB9
MSGTEASVEPLSWWMAALFFGTAIFFLAGHLNFKRGTRIAVKWVQYNYFNGLLPPLAREAPFNLLPASITLTLWGGIVILSHAPDGELWNDLIAIFAITSMIPFAFPVKWRLTGYPDAIKPQWLVEEERKRNFTDE